jgi:predicted TPR repeat methyltransferase
MPSDSPFDAATLLQQALALHRQGRFDQALQAYAAVLRLQPNQFDATHLSGVIARQRGDFDLAAEWISRAIAIDDRQAIAHCNLGTVLQALGRGAEALDSYDAALGLKPDYPMALFNRGNALRALGRGEAAVDSYARALALQPSYPECWRALAVQQQLLGRFDAALGSAGEALRQRPGDADALLAQGMARHGLGEHAAALADYDQALIIRPDFFEAHLNRGIALQRLGRREEGLSAIEAALALRPFDPAGQRQHGHVLRALGQHDAAIAAYRLALEYGEGPDGESAYALAALGAGPVPAAAPGAYVAALFDRYAQHFDYHLVEELAYEMPRILGQALGRQREPDAGADVVDLGCGTGLCAPYLRPHARALTGIDLSAGMLDKAAERGLYDRLGQAELAAFLRDETDAFDVAVAADVFVYIGDLAPAFAAAKTALRAGGLFLFSVEALESDEDDFRLRPSGRYAHAVNYLRRLAEEYGFAVLEAQPCAGRREGNEAVAATALVLRRRG